MKTLAELLVSFLELLEAEGRTLRDKTVRLFLAVTIFFIAGTLAIAGIVLIIVGIYRVLVPFIGAAAACFTLGGLILLASCALFKSGGKLSKS